MSAGGLTEITRVDLTLLILNMQPDCEKRVDTKPEAQCIDWRHLPVPSIYTDSLTGDDRVLPLFRVTP
jgi:hypothetical protein